MAIGALGRIVETQGLQHRYASLLHCPAQTTRGRYRLLTGIGQAFLSRWDGCAGTVPASPEARFTSASCDATALFPPERHKVH